MNSDKKIISFPHIGNYYVLAYSLFRNIFPECQIMIPKKMSRKTQELGEKYSPDAICTPFKYNLGNYIESLDRGANILIQGGGGCKYGYYAELQEQILHDLGYDFEFVSILDANKVNPKKVYSRLKKINPNLKFNSLMYQLIVVYKLLLMLDRFENYIRANIAYEVLKGNFENIHKQLLIEIMNANNLNDYKRINNEYDKKLKSVKLDKNKVKIKIGIVGELFSSMEPFASFFLEKKLADMSVASKRYTTATYLLFEKGGMSQKLLNESKKYIKYELGADGTESVAHSIELCKQGYDGIIHVKPFGCTPEINAIPILQKISQDFNVPFLYFTFDMQTSETGVNTRLEAFYDMIKMKKEKSGLIV